MERYDDDAVRFVHPHTDALIQGALLCTLFALLAAVVWGMGMLGWIGSVWALVAFINLGFWLLMLLVVWLWGVAKGAAIRAFWHSDRPLVRWHYTRAEWERIKGARKQAMQESIGIIPGCLAALLALAGLGVGVLVGLDEGLDEGLTVGVIGVLAGGVAGGVIGGTIMVSHVLAAQWSYHMEPRHVVALGEREVLSGRDYFKSDGSYRRFTSLEIIDGDPPELRIELINPKPRSGAEETWHIPVPHNQVEALRAALPRVRTGKGA